MAAALEKGQRGRGKMTGAAAEHLEIDQDTSRKIRQQVCRRAGGSNVASSRLREEWHFDRLTDLFVLTRLGSMLQFEFYFSDSNLPRDDYMKQRVAENPEVILSTIVSG